MGHGRLLIKREPTNGTEEGEGMDHLGQALDFLSKAEEYIQKEKNNTPGWEQYVHSLLDKAEKSINSARLADPRNTYDCLTLEVLLRSVRSKAEI